MTQDQEFIPTPLAADLNGTFSPALVGNEALQRFSDFLKALTIGAVDVGAWSIGHVKAVVEAGDGFLSMSSTTEDGKVRTKGELPSVDEWTMTVNVIVFGPDADKLESMLMDKVDAVLPGSKVNVYHAEGCEDPECFDPFCRRPDHVHEDDCDCDSC